ncbi:MAG: non-ribosomal peptide synthetase, partial [Bacteroidota bacterium]
TFKVSDMGDLLYIDFDYNSILYKPERIERFARYFKSLVSDIIARPDELIGEYVAPHAEELHTAAGRNYWDRQLRETETIAFPGKQANNSSLSSSRLQNELTVTASSEEAEAKALAVLQTLLFRYTGQTDLAIHYLENLQSADQKQIPLLLRTGLGGDQSIEHIQYMVKEELTSAIRYADSYRQQLCDQGQYQQAQRNANALFCRAGESMNQLLEGSAYDLVVQYQQTAEGLTLVINSTGNVFDSREFDRFCHYYHLIWNLASEAKDQPVDTLSFLPQEEQKELLEVLSGEKSDYPSDKTLHALFSEQAALYPDKLAVVDSTCSITYKELDERSGRLANYLLSNGLVERDKPVGVMMDKSAEMLVSFLGILKAGAGYMPLDPENPISRIADMVETASPVLIITNMDYMMQVQEFYLGNIVMPDIQEADINAFPVDVSITDESATQLAYVMFTSGSTGEPKGVVIEHRGVVRLVRDTNYVDFQPGEKMLSTSSFSFDGSTFEIWGMLLNGGQLIIYPKEQVLNIKFLEEKIVAHQIKLMWMTTSLFNELTENSEVIFQRLKYVLTGGDKMSVKHINKMRQQNSELRILNVYGPTENTTYSTFHPIEDYYQSDVPLGRPISNTEVYILDKQQRLVPQGVIGELYMGGDGLARGYLQKSESNDAKFIEHPYKKGERLYNTGDQGRWNTDGLLEFFGRNDHQVKIRGFRVELGEIETVMMRFPQIRRAKVVVKHQEQNEKYILAYYTNDGEPVSPDRIKDYLNENLPDYMVPASLIPIQSFPMNINGKIDVKKLPLPEVELHNYVAPANEVEAKLVDLWSDILKLDAEKIGTAADFFEIGGHSLRAATLANSISEEFGVTMQLIKIFEKTTIKEQAAFISIEKTLNESATKVEEEVTEIVI